MDRTSTLRPGERLDDRLVITDVLPAGGMGEVYRARDTKLQRDVAVKLLLRTAPHDLQRFIREAQAGAAFKHPNIVSIFDVGTIRRDGHDRPYLVMEFIEGTTLRERMPNASPKQIIRWMSEVADGLEELHRKGFIHRDLKPSNIMIGTDDRAQIVDFGLVKTDGSTITTTNTIVGTIDYLSPEQTETSKGLDFRTDIFSFGIVLYEGLTKRHPFHRATEYHTIHAINCEFPEPIRGPVGKIVSRCLKKKPTDRYDAAADIARDLRELERTSPRSATATLPAVVDDHDASTVKIATKKAPAPASVSSRRWKWIALVGTLLLLGVVLYKQHLLPGPAHPAEPSTPPPLRVAQQALPACGLTASPGTIIFGRSAKLAWSSSNAVDAVISPEIGIVGPEGTLDVSPRVTTTYHLVVTSASGIVAEGSVTVVVIGAPADLKKTFATGSISASPAMVTPTGEAAELRWNSFDASHVVITPSIGIVPLRGRIQVAPPITTTYTMTINNDTGDSAGRASATVYVDPAGASPGMVMHPAAVDCSAATQLGVSGTVSSDSSSCFVPAHRTVTQAMLTYTLDDGGSISINGREVFTKTPGVGAREGAVRLPVELFVPNNHFLLRVEARNAEHLDGAPVREVYGKAAIHLVTTDVGAGVEFGVTPRVITQGETAVINWSSIDATALTLNPLIGPVGPRGSMRVSPTQTTTYTLQGWSASGPPAKASVTLDVQRPRALGQQASVAPQNAAPAAIMSVSPSSIAPGQSAHLDWKSINATRIKITPGIGFVAPSGQVDVSPLETTTYTITVSNGQDHAQGTATLVVAAPASKPVSGSIIVTPDTIQRGEQILLQWNSFDATRVVITPDVGAVPLQGQLRLSPRQTTTYTIMIENAFSSTSGSATVNVIPAARRR